MKTDTPYFVICNPASGNGSAGKNWAKTKKILEQNFSFQFALTEYPRHAEQIAIDALKSGYTKILAVGGDGLLQEVANGILSQTLVPHSSITVGLISQGTGNDWRKTTLIPKKLIKMIEAIKKEETILQDVGLISFYVNGEKQQRYCVNFAGVGFDSYVVAQTASLKKFGAVAYLLGMGKCLFSFKKPILKISSVEKTFTTPAYICIAGIGKFGGGGMKLMPNADMDDGLFTVTVAKDFIAMEIILNLPKLYSGSLIRHKKVESWDTKKLKIEVIESTQDIQMEADGELLGGGPFELEIIPKALRVIVA